MSVWKTRPPINSKHSTKQWLTSHLEAGWGEVPAGLPFIWQIRAVMEWIVDQGFTVWLTGLSGAGKSTIAGLLESELRSRRDRVEVLDGDVVRTHLSKGLGFSKEDRDTNIRRIAFVCHLLTRNGVAVISAAISPYRDVRDEARRDITRFVEVYVKCPLDELVRRDVKGLYARAIKGEIANFTGVSDPYEEPLRPDVVVETDRETVAESVGRILAALEDRGYLAPVAVQVGGAR
jgi:adenylylsulfate kinase